MTVVIAPVIYRNIHVRTATALMAAMNAAPFGEQVILEPMYGDALVTRGRSLQATKFLTKYPDADVLVMIDDDVVFSTPDIWKIVEGARETRSLYGAAYLTHGITPHLTCSPWEGQRLDFVDDAQRNPAHVEYLPTGFLAIHRDVLTAMIDGEYRDADGAYRLHLCQKGSGLMAFYPFFDTTTVEERPGFFHYLSEDWAFCERANQLGFKCWVDQSIILQHMSEHASSIAEPHGAATGWDSVAFERPTTGDPLVDSLPEDLAEFSGRPLTEVLAALPAGSGALAQLWDNHTESEEQWYKHPDVGTAYALDLAYWHMRGGSPIAIIRDVVRPGQAVLDMGAGIGTNALIAAREGAHVTVDEPNPWMRNFSASRARKHNFPLLYATTHQPASFDVIICWHVFEHVENPEALLDDLLSYLKPEGTLILDWDFHVDDDHPMHHEGYTDTQWEAVLISRGLTKTQPGVYARTPVPVGG